MSGWILANSGIPGAKDAVVSFCIILIKEDAAIDWPPDTYGIVFDDV